MFLSEMTYKEFLESKIELAQDSGFEVNPTDINKALKPHQGMLSYGRLKVEEERYLKVLV